VDTFASDLRFAARLLRRHPGLTLVAVLSLALGIGVNTTIFSVVNAVLLAPLPLHEPERLVEIYTSPVPDMPYLTTSYPDFLDLRAQVDALSGLMAHALVRGVLARDGRSELAMGEVVTDNYFDLLGVRPALGRAFLPEENRAEGTHPVLVASHGFWQRRLGGRADVVGSRLRLSGVEYEVVGVAPPGFKGTIPGLAPEFWTPVMMVGKLSFSGIQSSSPSPGATRVEQRGTRWLFVTGRLAPGRSVAEARAQVETVVARLVRQYPDVNDKLKASVLASRDVRLHPLVDGVLTPAAALLLGAVALVLLIACANVANLLLARAAARRREMAVRLAVGAGRGRLVRQLLVESLLLAALGGLFGVGLALVGTRLVAALQPALPVPLAFEFDLDANVLLFALGATLATAFVFGLVPALQASRPALVPALKDAAADAPTGRRRPALGDALVVGQLAVSLLLLVAGALLLRGLLRAHRIDPGFAPERLATVSLNLQMMGYSPEQAIAFQRRMVGELRARPGVESVALVTRLPLASDINMEGILVPGRHKPGDDATPVDATWVEPDYFAVLGVPLVEGRGFRDADRQGAPLVAVINQAMARRFWPDRSAVGERFYTDGFGGPPVEVVGVVRDYKVRDLGEQPRPYIHFCWHQGPTRSTTVVARTAGPAAAAVGELRRAVQAMDAQAVFTDEGTLVDLLRATLAPTRVAAGLLGTFAGLALLLAAVGLYGVIAWSVARRTRELGVRVALGARSGDVLRLVLGQGLRLVAIGIALGSLGALAATRVLSSLLYGVSAADPLAFALGALVLLGVALLANLVPALRASRVDPLVALRHE
jgi:putative ABC transport system permease protein